MYKLELEFLSHICRLSLGLYPSLNNQYNKHLENDCLHINKNFDFINSKFKDIIVKSISSFTNEIDFFINYDEVTHLIEYIYHIFHFAKEQAAFLKNSYFILPELKNYQDVASRLIGIIIDKVNQVCTIDLKGVLKYNNSGVEVVNAAIHFQNVTFLRIKGDIHYDFIQSPLISNVHISKEMDNTFCYSLLGTDGADGVMMEITFTKLIVESY